MNFIKTYRNQHRQAGFTIVEILVVIVVVAILSVLVVVSYKGMQQRGAMSVISNDLQNAAGVFEILKYESGTYPTDMPADLKVSSGVVLSATSTTGDTFCINGYFKSMPSVKASWDPKVGLRQNALCGGATIGQAAGGTVPSAERGSNLVANFSYWTLSGTAAYNAPTGELTLGTSGSVRSPLVRVDSPRLIYVGGDMYATTASPHASLTPQGGHHISIYYYESDGMTPAMNSSNYTANGCAKGIALNAWQNEVQSCVFNGGPNVVYISYVIWSSASGYSSPDLKLRNARAVVVD